MTKYTSQGIDPTLVVMAAGMSKRYTDSGADIEKQVDPIRERGDPLWAFIVYDAVIRHEIRKIVPVIRKDFESYYKDDFGERMEKWASAHNCEIKYAYQQSVKELTHNPGYEWRQKMWGTAEALICAKDVVDEPFIILNGDDHYGLNTLGIMINFVNSPNYKQNSRTFAMPCYHLENVLSEHGSVTRGVCQEQNCQLTEIIETMQIERVGNIAVDRKTNKKIPLTALISMNMWLLDSSAFPLFEGGFAQFKASMQQEYQKAKSKDKKTRYATGEFLISQFMNELVKNGLVTVRVIPTNDPWFGITHLKDKDDAARILRERLKGEYPEDLWHVSN